MKNKFKNEKLLSDNVDELNLNNQIYNKLINNNIDTIGKLCNFSRSDLRSLDFVQSDIQSIIIKLQLKGLDIKGNEY